MNHLTVILESLRAVIKAEVPRISPIFPNVIAASNLIYLSESLRSETK